VKPRFGRRWRGSEAGRHEGGKYLAGPSRKGEPTSGLEPLTRSLRVIIRVLQEFAGVCKSRISKPVSLLSFAGCCTVLRSRWYQSGINRSIAPSQSCSRGARTQSTFSTSPRLVSIQLILDRYSHWMLSLAETLRTRCMSHWVRRSPLALGFPSVIARVHTATTRRGQDADSPLPRSFRRCSMHPDLSLRAA
jgi:hypothetical protein